MPPEAFLVTPPKQQNTLNNLYYLHKIYFCLQSPLQFSQKGENVSTNAAVIHPSSSIETDRLAQMGRSKNSTSTIQSVAERTLHALCEVFKWLGKLTIIGAVSMLLTTYLCPNVSSLASASISFGFGGLLGLVSFLGQKSIEHFREKTL